MSVVLGYWNIRGLGQSARLLLKYTGTEFQDVRYNQGDAPDFSREEWFSVKETLGLDFPNLPYLIDGDVKLTQSNTILGYIGRKNNLAGKSDAEAAVVDMIVCTAMDFKISIARLCYNPAMDDAMKEEYVKNAKTTLKRISDYLGDKPWFVGNEITFGDFPMYEAIHCHRMLEPTILDDYDNIKAFMDRFEALPGVKEFVTSPECKALPMNMKNATWGGN